MGLGGLEPPTSSLSGMRSSHLSYRPKQGPGIRSRGPETPSASAHPGPHTGGAGRDRTGDLLNANQALSQLSYSPRTGGRGPGAGGQRKGIPSLWPPIPSPSPCISIEASWMQGPTSPAHWPPRKNSVLPSGDARTGSRSAPKRETGFGVERLLLTVAPKYTN